MIASINDGNNISFNNNDIILPPSQRSGLHKNRRNAYIDKSATEAAAAHAQQMAAVDMMQNINTSSQTAAALILNDTSVNKTQSLKVLAAQSIAARNLLEPLQSNASTIALNRIDTVNVLEFLGDIYDNTIEIVNTE
ncbi:p12 [Catopsilia pomona nucleopolyhedrovirus]|uniref:p12 n=1 Tax=Catopsilia pomona nucleopolyhedrovirus TaxID=1850906 RepID=A0A172WZB6_9ABAC|nr:p12 [Catopsilia pomona nucleopolyhedrovirus]ANF29692.1 p12 [Catopsilia pomona nucleopolyhedrovirus]